MEEEGFETGILDELETGTLELLVTGLTGVEDDAGTTGADEEGTAGAEHEGPEPPFEHGISGIVMLELGRFGTGTVELVVTGTTGVEETGAEQPGPPEVPLP